MPTALFDDQVVHPPPIDCGDDDSGGPIRWTTIATFWTPPEAHLARLKLESEDIDCQFANENIVAVDFLLAPAVGGIKILVPEFEKERALALLNQPHGEAAAVNPVAFGVCPECGSANIDRPFLQVKTFWAAFVAMMMMGSVVLLPLGIAAFAWYLIMWREWRCRDCGNKFRREEGSRGFPIGEAIKPSPAAEE